MSNLIHSPYRTRTVQPTDLRSEAPKPPAPTTPAMEAKVRQLLAPLEDADTVADMLFGPISGHLDEQPHIHSWKARP